MYFKENTIKPIERYQDILTAEFNYIAQAAFQAQEDRARVTEFFIVCIGSIILAVMSFKIEGVDLIELYKWLSVLFGVILSFGAVTLLQLSRLRLAWFESIEALNTIKENLIAEEPGLENCFKWTNKNLPSKVKLGSIGFFKALQTAILSGIACSAIVYFSLLSKNCDIALSSLCLISIIGAAVMLFLFNLLPLLLKKSSLQ